MAEEKIVKDSILNSTKKAIGIQPEVTHFDVDIMIHINTAFSVLSQLGVGPKEGFSIETGNELWEEYYTDKRMDMIKTYLVIYVRLIFDAPSNSFLVKSLEDTKDQLEWRLKALVETEL